MAAAPVAAPGRAFPKASDCSGHALQSPVLGSSVEPVYWRKDSRGPGNAYFWEIRRWFSFFGVGNATETAKAQKKNGVWSSACAHWTLPVLSHYCHGSQEGWNTSMCSSQALVPWLFSCILGFKKAHSYHASRKSVAALNNIWEMAEKGYLESPEDKRDSTMCLPGGVLCQIGVCGMLSVPLWNIKQKWPSVEADWRQLAIDPKYTSWRLEAFPECEVLPINSLITAMFLRELAQGSEIPAMRAVRSALLAPIVMFFELDVSRRLASIPANLESAVVQSDKGPSLKKRLRMSLVQKRQVISKAKNHGSTEAITLAIQSHRGLASLTSGVKVAMYLEKSEAQFTRSGRFKF